MIGFNLASSLLICIFAFLMTSFIYRYQFKKRLIAAVELATVTISYALYLIIYFVASDFLNMFEAWLVVLIISMVVTISAFKIFGLDVDSNLVSSDPTPEQVGDEASSLDIDSKNGAKNRFTSYWFVRLAALGAGVGVLQSLSKGAFSIGFLLAFGLIFMFIFAIIGLFIDAFTRRLYRHVFFTYPFSALSIFFMTLWLLKINPLSSSYIEMYEILTFDFFGFFFQAVGAWFVVFSMFYIGHLIFVKRKSFRFEESAFAASMVSLLFFILGLA